MPILEVPDITFWVTQDTDGDGDQETIYSDGYFQVGWKSGPLSDVLLHASHDCPDQRQFAKCLRWVNVSSRRSCSSGLMPARMSPTSIQPPDPTRGFGLRPNPPHADGCGSSIQFSRCRPSPGSAGQCSIHGNAAALWMQSVLRAGSIIGCSIRSMGRPRCPFYQSGMVHRPVSGTRRSLPRCTRCARMVPDSPCAGRLVSTTRVAGLAHKSVLPKVFTMSRWRSGMRPRT